MDKTTIIGLFLGVIAVGVGMVMKGVPVTALGNPAAILIIFVGTAASIFIAFPMSTVKNIPTLFKIIFSADKNPEKKELIHLFTKLAEQTRKEGLLSMETQMKEFEDPFLHTGLQFAIDGQTPEFIKEVLIEKIEAMESRHQEGISVFSQAGTYAPTLGVLGAVIGLIAALGNMQDMDVLGHAISAAFIATLFGIFSGYVLWHPFANKLREKSKKEVEIKEIMIEGILSISTGDSAIVVRDKLGSYLSTKELVQLKEEQANEQA
ncbi:flagellar motor stator protein MotA [Virgibacillus sp. SK37]|uniref:flagellar motor stator protein MotA n=1 Tax=Virgibacillus sp. SK37 TaxID=403957 RepID=UPI0004D1A399|nr:flagellar motor stator protein MotA [Virgibacillus sp. SK37]AIF44203.1 flagellar motor protein MotA [Virgibacillus sp. SK37]